MSMVVEALYIYKIKIAWERVHVKYQIINVHQFAK